MNKTKEIMAKAMHFRNKVRPWDSFPEEQPHYLEQAEAALQALSDAGMVIVPREANSAMLGRGSAVIEFDVHSGDHAQDAIYVWRSMITAAQEE